MKKAPLTQQQITGILLGHQAGAKCADLCRKKGMWESTFYARKATYSQTSVVQI